MKIISTSNKIATIQVLRKYKLCGPDRANEYAEGEEFQFGTKKSFVEFLLDLLAVGAYMTDIPQIKAWMVEAALSRANEEILVLAQRIAAGRQLLPTLLGKGE